MPILLRLPISFDDVALHITAARRARTFRRMMPTCGAISQKPISGRSGRPLATAFKRADFSHFDSGRERYWMLIFRECPAVEL